MRKSHGLVFSIIIAITIFIAPMFVLIPLVDNEDFAILLSYLVSLPLFVLAINCGFGGNLNISMKYVKKNEVLFIVVLSLLLYFIEIASFELVSNFLEFKDRNDVDFYSIYDLTRIILLGPIIEEMMFRGILLSKLKKVMNIKIAIIMQASVFTIIHGTDKFLPLLLGGIMYGVVYEYYDSIFYPVLLHILNNLIIVILVWCGINNGFGIEWNYILGLIALIGFVFLYLKKFGTWSVSKLQEKQYLQ